MFYTEGSNGLKLNFFTIEIKIKIKPIVEILLSKVPRGHSRSNIPVYSKMVKFWSLSKALQEKGQNDVFSMAFPRTWSGGHQRSNNSMKVKLRFYWWYKSHIKRMFLTLAFQENASRGHKKVIRGQKYRRKGQKMLNFNQNGKWSYYISKWGFWCQ